MDPPFLEKNINCLAKTEFQFESPAVENKKYAYAFN